MSTKDLICTATNRGFPLISFEDEYGERYD